MLNLLVINYRTPVCTTELGEVSKLSKEWEKRGVKVLGLSCNDLDLHEEWIKEYVHNYRRRTYFCIALTCSVAPPSINELSNTDLKFPIIADPERKIAHLYVSEDHTITFDGRTPILTCFSSSGHA